jgi:hypothetical protein
MIKLYGKDAENGVIIFEDARIMDKPPAEYYKDILSDKKDKNVTEVRTDNKIFEKVEIPPSFPGGKEAWNRYLTKYINPAIPVQKGAPAGQYSVIAQFVVKTDGTIEDIRTLTFFGYGMEEQVIELIKKGPRWIPARQNGKIVKAYVKQPVTFVITDEAGNVPPVRLSSASPVDKRKPADNQNKPVELPEIVTVTLQPKDYNNPANWDINDEAYRKWRQDAISEVIALARKEGKAAYYYKGRTYVFAKIDDSKPENVNTFYENDGFTRQFILNGKLIHSIDEINSRYRRENIKSIKLVFPNEAKQKYNADGSILEIETFDYKSPSVTLTGSPDPSINVEDFKNLSVYQLLKVPENSEIESFTFSIDTDNGELAQYANKGSVLNSSVESLIKYAKAGKTVTIDEIRVTREGVSRKLPSRIYFLK